MVITIKKILITSLLLLMTNTSIAAIGDVYSCEWISSTFSDSKVEEPSWNSPEEFLKKKFVFRREENNITFEKDFRLSSTDLKISLNSDEVFVASSVKLLSNPNNFVSVVYKDGNLTITEHLYTSSKNVFVVTDISKCYVPNLD